MATSNVDLQVRILTDANTAALQQTTKGLDDVSAAGGKVNKSTAQLSNQMTSARAAGDGLAKILSGDLAGGMRTLGMVTQSTNVTLAQLGGYAALIAIAAQLAKVLGTAAGKMSTLGSEAAQLKDPLTDLERQARLTTEAINEINEISLDRAKGEFAAIQKGMAQFEAREGLNKRREIANIQTATDEDVARMQAETPEGPEQERAIVQRRAQGAAAIAEVEARYAAALEQAISMQELQVDATRKRFLAEEEQAEDALAAAQSVFNDWAEKGLDNSANLVALANARDLLAAAQERRAEFDVGYEDQKFELGLKRGGAAIDASKAASSGRISGLNQDAALTKIDNREASATASAQAQADRERVKALEAELKDKERSLIELGKTGPQTVDQQRGEAEAAARELENYAGLKPSQGGGSISMLRELRANADRESKELSTATNDLATANAQLLSQVAALRRNIETISSQMKNAEQ